MGVLLALQVFLIPKIVYLNDGEPARAKTNSRVTQGLVIVQSYCHMKTGVSKEVMLT